MIKKSLTLIAYIDAYIEKMFELTSLVEIRIFYI